MLHGGQLPATTASEGARGSLIFQVKSLFSGLPCACLHTTSSGSNPPHYVELLYFIFIIVIVT